ncbi:formiminoglutamase [Nitrosomonas sp. Nm51]|uniref:N-formylglutamate amidohydrolase n=1 Tax=Nitrosomonas sp. Nm51 TaxID=133720 RepID=UPI0008B7AE65|nr:N-formylglutamate amidohydrolase [Nitrosomonas sp. Nm51]SER20420.1 formiminoglutamase [Nitrosomonas sp. Nm51]
MTPFPVLLSIPHGGDQAPPELIRHIVISKQAMLADSDFRTREIYGLSEEAAAVVDTPIARVYVDLNRAPDDLPPANPDGVIKRLSCHGVQIYRDEIWRDQALVHTLLEKYYVPYHQKIQFMLQSRQDLELMLDCHSMEAVGPVIGPDQGAMRPAICLGSRHGGSCSPATVQRFAAIMRRAFELREGQVTIDRPFAGGYITRHYGNNPLPCIQIELNRGLYLDKGGSNDEHAAQIAIQKIVELQQKFRYALELFFVRA